MVSSIKKRLTACKNQPCYRKYRWSLQAIWLVLLRLVRVILKLFLVQSIRIVITFRLCRGSDWENSWFFAYTWQWHWVFSRLDFCFFLSLERWTYATKPGSYGSFEIMPLLCPDGFDTCTTTLEARERLRKRNTDGTTHSHLIER